MQPCREVAFAGQAHYDSSTSGAGCRAKLRVTCIEPTRLLGDDIVVPALCRHDDILSALSSTIAEFRAAVEGDLTKVGEGIEAARLLGDCIVVPTLRRRGDKLSALSSTVAKVRVTGEGDLNDVGSCIDPPRL